MVFEAALKNLVKLERQTDDQEVNDVVQVVAAIDNVEKDDANEDNHDEKDKKMIVKRLFIYKQ